MKFGLPLPSCIVKNHHSLILRYRKSFNGPREKKLAAHSGLGYTFMSFSIAWPIVHLIPDDTESSSRPGQEGDACFAKGTHIILGVKIPRLLQMPARSRPSIVSYCLGIMDGRVLPWSPPQE